MARTNEWSPGPAALSGERLKGQEGPPASLASTGEPSAPPAWLIGEIRPLDVRRALRELLALALLLVLVGLAACAWNPGPTPDPTPPPPPPWAPPEAEQCHLMTPPATAQCWHRPLPGPWLYICADGTNVGDPELCPIEPDPDPTPAPACIVEADLVGTTCGGQEFRAKVKRATDALGDMRGQPALEVLDAVAAKLAEEGLCAIGGIEAVFILRSDGLAEENHTVAFKADPGGGPDVSAGWANSGFGKFKGCHSGVPPVECGEPDPLGRPGMINGGKHHQDWDTTYLVHKDYEYCLAAGMNRGSCPVRKEGNYQREACERRVIGDQQWWCNGEPIESNENPAQAHCIGHVKTCTEDGATCWEATW
jgi:hypothetical protein